MEKNNLWFSVGNKCLQRAIELLDNKTAPAAATAKTVRVFVETAIEIDKLNLQWEEKSRCGEQAFLGRLFSQPKVEN